MSESVPTALPDTAWPWTGAAPWHGGKRLCGQRETFAAIAERLTAASVKVRRLGSEPRPEPEVIAAAEVSVRQLADAAEALQAQFAPEEAGGLALVVPRRSHAFSVVRSTKCLPAFMPSGDEYGDLNCVSGSGSVQKHSLGRPEAEVVTDAKTCAAMAMGLQLVTASVTAALCGYAASAGGEEGKGSGESSTKRARVSGD